MISDRTTHTKINNNNNYCKGANRNEIVLQDWDQSKEFRIIWGNEYLVKKKKDVFKSI